MEDLTVQSASAVQRLLLGHQIQVAVMRTVNNAIEQSNQAALQLLEAAIAASPSPQSPPGTGQILDIVV